ncbi:MAG: response regulator, partial [Microcoleus sp. SIO2G3]|nr:response regulator [Microcoleus sp. SIO2G3]
MFLSNYQILIVDDIPDNVFLLQMLLEAECYEVETAPDGSTALKKVKECQPNLILLDVMMPDLSGFEVTRRIRQDQAVSDIPIVLITAHDEASLDEGLQAGANEFIRKPVECDRLIE